MAASDKKKINCDKFFSKFLLYISSMQFFMHDKFTAMSGSWDEFVKPSHSTLVSLDAFDTSHAGYKAAPLLLEWQLKSPCCKRKKGNIKLAIVELPLKSFLRC